MFGLVVEIFLKLMALMTVVDKLDGLLEADGDEETDNDGGDVDTEVAPGAGGVWCGGWTSSMGVASCRISEGVAEGSRIGTCSVGGACGVGAGAEMSCGAGDGSGF